tara:strand:- start:277 stop:486 length:210 start_codon:yes stop_codon:yes gene_type:complete
VNKVIKNLKQVWKLKCPGPSCPHSVEGKNQTDAMYAAGRAGFMEMAEGGNVSKYYCPDCFRAGNWKGKV